MQSSRNGDDCENILTFCTAGSAVDAGFLETLLEDALRHLLEVLEVLEV